MDSLKKESWGGGMNPNGFSHLFRISDPAFSLSELYIYSNDRCQLKKNKQTNKEKQNKNINFREVATTSNPVVKLGNR